MIIDRQTMLLLPVGTRKPPTFQVSRAFSGYDGGVGYDVTLVYEKREK